jgi:hypothetical protein
VSANPFPRHVLSHVPLEGDVAARSAVGGGELRAAHSFSLSCFHPTPRLAGATLPLQGRVTKGKSVLAAHLLRPSFAYKQKDEAASARPFAEALLMGAFSKQREAERRKAHCPTMSAPADKSAKLVCARLRAAFLFCGTQPRTRLRHSPPATTPMAQLQNRVSRGGADGCFTRFANPKEKTCRG